MCLVLGCPGSGCSTFLKTIANQREGYARISGDVLYAGIDSDVMLKYYKGEVVYNQEGLSQNRKVAVANLKSRRRYSYRYFDCCPNPGICPFDVRTIFN